MSNDSYIKIIDLDEYLGQGFNGKFCFFGCQGIASSWVKYFQGSRVFTQNSIGLAIRSIKPDITLVLGDNFYDDGLSGDPRKASREFRQAFIEPYRNLTCFCLLGNHDYYIHNRSRWGKHYLLAQATGFKRYWHSTAVKTVERGMRQVELSNHPENHKVHPYPNSPKQWNMPYRYFLLHSRIADFFILDSNSFLFDCDQQDWLMINLEARSKVSNKKFLVMHHPFISGGKRYGSMEDLKLYAMAFGCSDARFKELTKSAHTYGTGEIGALIYHYLQEKLRLLNKPNYFDCLICAHDHMMTVDRIRHKTDSHSIIQVISGGGGAALANSSADLHALYNIRRQGRVDFHCETIYADVHYGFNDLDINTMTVNVRDYLGNIKNSYKIED